MLEAEWRQVLLVSVVTGTKEEESSTATCLNALVKIFFSTEFNRHTKPSLKGIRTIANYFLL
jgi:hypothetical protein